MSKTRILLILSLVVLGLLIVLNLAGPVATGQEYSEVAREQLLEREDEWIIQFDVLNHEGKETRYAIEVLVAGQNYNEKFAVQDGARYTYIHHIPRQMAGETRLTIFKEGQDAPFEQATYYLR